MNCRDRNATITLEGYNLKLTLHVCRKIVSTAVLLAVCSGFADARVGIPPIPVEINVYLEMQSPRIGQAFTAIGGGNLQVNGLVSLPGTVIAIQFFNPSTNAWDTVTTTPSSSAASIPAANGTPAGYSWGTSISMQTAMPGTSTPYWTPGGLLRLRAKVASTVPGAIYQAYAQADDGSNGNASDCYTQQSAVTGSWVTAAAVCQTAFPYFQAPDYVWPTVTLVSIEQDPYHTTAGGFTGFLLKPVGKLTSALQGPKTADEANTDSYYAYINAPATLDDFKTLYGFSLTPATLAAGEIVSAYYNFGDLGIGREMHCRNYSEGANSTSRASGGSYPINASGLACYVTNYGTISLGDIASKNTLHFGDAPQADLDAATYQDPNDNFATVAMVQHSNKRVDFMVYLTALGNTLTDSAALDNFGTNKAIPNNCLSCHGGSVNTGIPRASNNFDTSGASFLAFDQDARILNFSSTSPNTLTDQAANLQALNTLVLNAPQSSVGVKNLIQAMYPSGTSSLGNTYAENFVPASWDPNNPVGSPEHTTAVKLYQEVVHPYCSSCHSTNNSYPFNSYTDFQNSVNSIENDVCAARNMPQAEQTARHFWSSSARAWCRNARQADGSGNPTQ